MRPLHNEALNSTPGPHPFRIGLFGIGLDTYWQHVSGLKRTAESLYRAGGSARSSSGSASDATWA